MRNKRKILSILLSLLLCLTACSSRTERSEQTETGDEGTNQEETADMDENGDIAIIPKDFTVSEQEGEHTVNTGVVVIGPDGSEFVWVPTT